jgi:hypothetical protein
MLDGDVISTSLLRHDATPDGAHGRLDRATRPHVPTPDVDVQAVHVHPQQIRP